MSQLTSAAAALNYLCIRGWEVVGASDMPYDLDKAGTITNQLRNLPRRRTP